MASAQRLSRRIDKIASFIAVVGIALSVVLEVISRVAPFDYPFILVALSALIIFVAARRPNDTKTSKVQQVPARAPFTAEQVEAARHRTIVMHRFTAEERKGNEGFVVTHWKLAEHSAMMWMRNNGHPGARVTKAGPDGGVDVVSSSAIAQVKDHSNPIGPAPIERLAGTARRPQHRGREAIFFSCSGFTAPGLASGRELGVALYQLQDSRRWVRVA